MSQHHDGEPAATGVRESQRTAAPRGTRTTGRRTNVRWLVVAMCVLGTSINYLDRANLSIAMPDIVSEFGISHTVEGLILGAFFWTYALFQLPSGHFVDRIGARVMYTFAVIWWSVFTALTAVATGFASLFGYRLGLGVGYRDPNRHRKPSVGELEYIADGGARGEDEAAAGPALRWRELFRYRTVWGTMLGFFCLNFVIYSFLTWFPSYLTDARGFSLLKTGFFGMIPPIVAIFGGWFGGWVSDRLYRRTGDLNRARKICLVCGMLFSFFIGALYDLTGSLAVPLVIVGGFAILGAATYALIIKRIEPLPLPAAAH